MPLRISKILSKPNNLIKFFAEEHLLGTIPSPIPAQKMLPQYFQKILPQTDSHPQSSTVKRCVPFLEASSAGYIIPFWTDVLVVARDGDLRIEFPQNAPISQSLGQHDYNQIEHHPLSKKPYGNLPLKWINPWGIETPKGWSVLITQPLNHLETRFKLLDGVVDTDEYYNQINFPFLWTGGDGEFYIPQGTPLAQVIPFQRQSLEMEVCVEDVEKRMRTTSKINSVFRHGYRRKIWHKLRDSK